MCVSCERTFARPTAREQFCRLNVYIQCRSLLFNHPSAAHRPPPPLPCACICFPQFRQANRDKAIREVKERAKKMKQEKAKASKQAAGAKAAPAPKAVGRGKR